MVKVLLYQTESEVGTYLKKTLAQNAALLLVTPNPEIADLGREKFENQLPAVNAVTFAKFMKDSFQDILKKNPEFELYKKSKLYLFLANAYRKKYQEYDYNQFEIAFNLLTQIRSYSQDLETIKDILTTNLKAHERLDCVDFICDPFIAELVVFFHLIMENVHAIDEHRQTKEVTESIRESLIAFQSPILFWGFDFFNPMQVEMLSAIGECTDVYIPMPKMAKDESTRFDWINWLKHEEIHLIQSHPHILKQTLDFISFRPGYVSEVVKATVSLDSDVYLGSNDFDIYSHFDIPLENLSYKTNVTLFNEVLSQIENEILSFLKNNQNDYGSLIVLLENEVKKSILTKDFRKIKVISMVISSLNLYRELNGSDFALNNFDVRVIMEVLSLDVPRTSFILTTGEKNISRLRNLSHLIAVDYSKKNIIIFSHQMNGPKFKSDGPMDAVLRNLSIIGPVRTKEFDFSLIKSRLHEMFQHSDCLLFLENQLLEHDPGVNNLLESFQLIEKKSKPILNQSIKTSSIAPMIISKKLEQISATKLQSYIDCPLQYYHKYHVKDFPMIKLVEKWNFLEVGGLEHSVIANFVNDNHSFDEKKFNDFIMSQLKNYARSSNKNMDDHELVSPFVEIKSKTHNIVVELLRLKSIQKIQFQFEYELPNERLSSQFDVKSQGSVDLLTQGDFVMLLDFKRGAGSIPSRTDFFNFVKIQVWFYLQRLRSQLPSKMVFGYVNLTQIEDSLLFVTDDELFSQLKSMGLRLFDSLEIFPKELNEELNCYGQLEDKIISALVNDKLFSPKPRESSLCGFCELKLVCSKGASI